MDMSTAGSFDASSFDGLASILGGGAEILGGVASSRRAGQNAKLLEELGLLNADEVRREGRALEGAQVAAATTTTGSALEIILADAVETEVDALRAKFGFDAQAAVVEQEGQDQLIASILQGSGRILGGIRRAQTSRTRRRTPNSRSVG